MTQRLARPCAARSPTIDGSDEHLCSSGLGLVRWLTGSGVTVFGSAHQASFHAGRVCACVCMPPSTGWLRCGVTRRGSLHQDRARSSTWTFTPESTATTTIACGYIPIRRTFSSRCTRTRSVKNRAFSGCECFVHFLHSEGKSFLATVNWFDFFIGCGH